MSQLVLSSLEATKRLSELVASSITDSIVITLSGNLGAGKTTFVQFLASGLGVEEVVTSPTFTMMNEYHSGRIPLYHMDLYRVGESIDKAERQNQADIVTSLDHFAMEFEEILETRSVVVIEWPKYFLVDGKNYLDNVFRLEININTPRFNEKEDKGEEFRSFQLKANGEEAKLVVDKVLSRIDDFEEISVTLND